MNIPDELNRIAADLSLVPVTDFNKVVEDFASAIEGTVKHVRTTPTRVERTVYLDWRPPYLKGKPISRPQFQFIYDRFNGDVSFEVYAVHLSVGIKNFSEYGFASKAQSLFKLFAKRLPTLIKQVNDAKTKGDLVKTGSRSITL